MQAPKIGGEELLGKHIPEGTMVLVHEWYSNDPVRLIIHSPRSSKLGDYRPAYNDKPPRISINSDLHPVEFLVTLAHEFAHAENYSQNGRKAKPHGEEWKQSFRKRLREIIEIGILDERYTDAIKSCYFNKNGFNQRCDLLRRIFDQEKSGLKIIRVENIPEGSEFIIGGKRLIKGTRRRTRFECREKRSGRIYTVHSMAEITEFKTP